MVYGQMTRSMYAEYLPLTMVNIDVFTRLLPFKVRMFSNSFEVQVIQLKRLYILNMLTDTREKNDTCTLLHIRGNVHY